MCVILLWPSKIKSSLILMQNVFNVCALRTNWLKILMLEDLGWIQVFFWKTFRLILMHFFIENNVLWGVSALNCPVFSKIWFFHASFMFRIHMHCIVFCIHLVVLQSYLSLFSHITCIHFATLGTQLDQKIDWLIFELCTF